LLKTGGIQNPGNQDGSMLLNKFMSKNIIFDWSGTLSNNLHSFQYVCRNIFQQYGLKEISLDEIRRNFELPYMKFWNKYLPDISREIHEKEYRHFIHKADPAFLYEGVEDVLKSLKNRNIKMFVLSSDPISKLSEETKKDGINSYFIEIFGEVYQKDKHIPRIIDKYVLDKTKTFYIGDTCGDIEAGKNAGVKTIGITWGYQHRQILAKSNPDYMIDKITELEDII
jgi:phosphoglycolate phosphatase